MTITRPLPSLSPSSSPCSCAPSSPPRVRLGLVLLGALSAAACDDPDDDPYAEAELEARVLVGTVDDTDLVLGALLDGDVLSIYQCGGDETFATHTRWFRGLVGNGDDPDAFSLVYGDMTLRGQRTADGLHGELVLADGTEHAFAVDPVGDDDVPGVYVAEHDGLRTGVVVREVGGELTAQGASCTDRDECSQVIILPPLAVTDETLPVQVDADGMVLDVVVSRTLVAP